MTPETQCIYILQGQALDLVIPVSDSDGNAVDVEGATVEFGLSESPTESPTEMIPTTESGNEITASLTSAKNLELGPGKSFFSCWVTINGESTPVARGWLYISESTRG